MTARHEVFLGTRRFGSLDGLRCLSILMVLWHHTAADGFQRIPLAQRGAEGVNLFFAISGFLITTLLLREKDRSGTIAMRKFYLRRTLRIFPLYYAVVAVQAVLALAGLVHSGDEYLGNLPYYLTYTANFIVPEPAMFALAWSLATEEQFYLTWPWLERRFGPWVTLSILGAVVGVAALLQLGLLGAVLPQGTLGYLLVSRIAIPILLGVMFAHLLHRRRSFERLAPILGRRTSSSVILILVLIHLSLDPTGWEGVHVVLIYVLFALLVTSCVMREDHHLAPLFSLRLIADVGVVSYGIYLLHMLVYSALLRGHLFAKEQWVVAFVLTSVGAYLTAKLSWRYFEAVFLRMKDCFAA